MTEQKNTSTESLQRIEFGHQSVQERIKPLSLSVMAAKYDAGELAQKVQ